MPPQIKGIVMGEYTKDALIVKLRAENESLASCCNVSEEEITALEAENTALVAKLDGSRERET